MSIVEFYEHETNENSESIAGEPVSINPRHIAYWRECLGQKCVDIFLLHDDDPIAVFATYDEVCEKIIACEI